MKENQKLHQGAAQADTEYNKAAKHLIQTVDTLRQEQQKKVDDLTNKVINWYLSDIEIQPVCEKIFKILFTAGARGKSKDQRIKRSAYSRTS